MITRAEVTRLPSDNGSTCLYPRDISGPGCPGLYIRPSVRSHLECAATCCADSACIVWQWRALESGDGICSTGIPLGDCAAPDSPAPDIDEGVSVQSVVGGRRQLAPREEIICNVDPSRSDKLVATVKALQNDLHGFKVGYYLAPPGYRHPNGCFYAAMDNSLGKFSSRCTHSKVFDKGLPPGQKRPLLTVNAQLCEVDRLRMLVRLPRKSAARPLKIQRSTHSSVQALVISDESSFAKGIPILTSMGLVPRRVNPVFPGEVLPLDCTNLPPAPPPSPRSREPPATAIFFAQRKALSMAAAYNGPSLILERDWTIADQAPEEVGEQISAAAKSADKMVFFGLVSIFCIIFCYSTELFT